MLVSPRADIQLLLTPTMPRCKTSSLRLSCSMRAISTHCAYNPAAPLIVLLRYA